MTVAAAIGTKERPLHVGVVGAGPAGFYTAMALLDQEDTRATVDLLDRLPTPYGLVRAGVAPDHQKLKGVVRIYEKLGEDPRFRFFGNVELGRDVSVADLARCYDQVVYATGNESDRRLGIPGEHLVGCAPASVFVGWYNGHPDYRDAHFDLSGPRAVIVGNGNVAIDVARILARSPADLARTDIAEHALSALTGSRVRQVVIAGRRGPMQAAFAPSELKELLELPGVSAHVDPSALELDEVSKKDLLDASPKNPARRNYELLAQLPARSADNTERQIEFRFLTSPLEFSGDASEHVRRLRLCRNRLVRDADGSLQAVPTDEEETLDVDLALISVGSESKRIAGLPFDERRGVIANVEGRVLDLGTRETLPNQYCVGWARTGAKGLIASQKTGALEVVARMLSDVRRGSVDGALNRPDLASILDGRNVPWISFTDWRVIDQTEVERGQPRGAPRSKFVEVPAMLSLVEMKRRGW